MYNSLRSSICTLFAVWNAVLFLTKAQTRGLRKNRRKPGIIFDQEDEYTSRVHKQLMKDILVDANLWSEEAKILSAEYAFDGILGIPPPYSSQSVKEAGAAFEVVRCSNGSTKKLSRVPRMPLLVASFGHPTKFGDGLPVVFSWPVLPSTANPTDFLIILNNNETVVPDAISVYPNSDYNERNTIVLISPDMGNRLRPDEDGALYPVEVRVTEDKTPLELFGPDGPVSAVGFSYQTQYHPYVDGPKLITAKLSKLTSKDGDEGPKGYGKNRNSGKHIYGKDAEYRLRVLTNWGISPDGLLYIRPDQYEEYFLIEAELSDGEKVDLVKTNVPYTLDGHEVEILGLAELGAKKRRYDDCYVDDRDNQIDIILRGDEAAMRMIRSVVLPSSGDYKAVYNPGGPGIAPEKGIRYTAPSVMSATDVIMAIDDPMTVNHKNVGVRSRKEKNESKRDIQVNYYQSPHSHY